MNLDAMLAEAVKAKARADEAKAEKARLRDGRLAPKERDAISAKVREWESAHEYTRTGFVFRELRYICSICASVRVAGGQVLVRQQHNRIAGTTRYVPCSPADGPCAGVPMLRDTVDMVAPMCGSCASSFGFPDSKE